MPPEENDDTLRSALEAAFDGGDDEQTPPANDGAAPAPSTPPADEPASQEPVEPEATGPARDASGRFTKKADGALGATPEAGAEKPVAGTPPPASPLSPSATPGEPVSPTAAPAERAPQSWKPGAREHWAALPADVRAEVLRRESDVQRTLQETAQARRTADQFMEAVRPYEAMIRAEGGNPLAAVSTLLQTAAALRTAPPPMRAQLVANIIKQYGVDIEALDMALAGQAPQASAQPQYHDPRLDQLLAQIEHEKQARYQAAQAEQERTVTEFAKDKEFFEDVRPLMSQIMRVATEMGERIDLQTAYDRAIAMRPDIAQIVAQRTAAANAAKARASTQRARAASSSVRNAPAVAPAIAKERDSLRDALEDAFDSANAS